MFHLNKMYVLLSCIQRAQRLCFSISWEKKRHLSTVLSHNKSKGKKKEKKKNSTWCSPSHRSPRENTIIFLDSARRHLSFWLSTYLSDWKYWKLIKHLKRCFILAPLILNIEIWQLKDSNWSKQDSWSRTLEFWTELLS